jgi:hypothetical protein
MKPTIDLRFFMGNLHYVVIFDYNNINKVDV